MDGKEYKWEHEGWRITLNSWDKAPVLTSSKVSIEVTLAQDGDLEYEVETEYEGCHYRYIPFLVMEKFMRVARGDLGEGK